METSDLDVLARSVRVARENAQRHARERPGPARPAMPPVRVRDDAYAARERQRERAAQVEKCLAACGVPPRYRDATLSGDYLAGVPDAIVMDGQPEPARPRGPYRRAAEQVRRLDAEPGIVCLVGPRGPGKTWIACGVVLDLCRAGRAARWLHVEDYFDGIKRRYDTGDSVEAYERNHLRPELLALDALENRGDTPWEDRQLIRVVTKRHELRLKTILISNQDVETFKRRVGDSIVSRTQDDAGAIVVCDWPSLRGSTR